MAVFGAQINYVEKRSWNTGVIAILGDQWQLWANVFLYWFVTAAAYGNLLSDLAGVQ